MPPELLFLLPFAPWPRAETGLVGLSEEFGPEAPTRAEPSMHGGAEEEEELTNAMAELGTLCLGYPLPHTSSLI